MTLPTVTEAIQRAYNALQSGDKRAARHWAELALAQDATLEEPWLLLAAVATPRASVEFLRRALQANPGSERAKKGLDWALKRLHESETKHPAAGITQPARAQAVTQPVKRVQTEQAASQTQPTRVAKPSPGHKNTLKSTSLFLVLSIVACLLIAAFFLEGAIPARAFISSLVALPRGATEAATEAEAALPTLTPLPQAHVSATSPPQPSPTQSPPPTLSITPTQPPVLTDSASPPGAESPTSLPAEPSPTPLPTDTPAPEQAAPAPNYESGKLILVDISEQHMYVYENGALVYSFVVSTGMNSGTRAGTFSVLNKIPSAYGSTWNIWMPNWLGIYWSGHLQNGIHALPILPNGQRLWAGYLGRPISYGCVVLGTYESELLYHWAEVGTPVVIQY